jgi:sortase A
LENAGGAENAPRRRPGKKGFLRRHAPTLILATVFLVGLSVLLYPVVSDYVNSLHQSRVIAEYSQSVVHIDDARYTALLAEARAYNESLGTKANRYILSDEERAEYNSLLSVSGTGVMGYLEIPAIRVKLPIYHGTGENVLQVGIGHMEGTSLPVGGVGTHAVVTGHRGLPSSLLLTDLNKLTVGDLFMFTVLDELLTYEVDQIVIVEPHEIGAMDIAADMDYATLVTCTPYGINSHRLLVRGHRTDNVEETDVRVTADARLVDSVAAAAIFAAPMLVGLLVVVLIKYRKR